jgi:(2R)-3-sulfolactate dehydrogenase (NADP+)
MPCSKEGPVIIDQSCTAGAYVGIQQAMAEGRPIPEGWALDAEGNPTTDPAAALSGVLLPFGGYRGANLALIVELLAAGLTGGNWSHAAPAFNSGHSPPGVGLLIIAIDPAATGGADSARRAGGLIDFMRRDPGVHVPGLQKRRTAAEAQREGLNMDEDLWDRVKALALR